MLPVVLFKLFQRYEVGNPQPTVSLIGLPAEGKKLGKKRDGFAVLALRHRLWLLLAFCAAVVLWITPGFLALIWGAQSAPAKYYNSRFPEAVAALVAALLLFVLPVNWRQREFTIFWRQAVKID